MLVRLSIRDIVLIERLDIAFGPGLTVLTGETGAGKSILLDSLSLALGGRGDGALVRTGAKQGQVTAVFAVPADHAALEALAENDILPEEAAGDGSQEIILRRVQSPDGRTRAYLNDQPVSVGLLKSVGDRLVEIHGQHAGRALVDPATHRRLLDAFGGLQGAAEDVARLWRSWRDAERAAEEHAARIEHARKEADFLRAAVEELEKLDPEPGEEESLAERRQTMMAAEKIAGDLDDAREVLDGPRAPVGPIADLMRRLERKSAGAETLLTPIASRLGDALDALEEARLALNEALAEIDFDPHELERVEERLFALRGASRKYDVAVEDLPALATRCADALAEIDHGEERLAALRRAAETARDAYDRAARALSERRRAAGEALAAAVEAELPPLKLERARFFVDQETDPDGGGADGIDRIAFHVQTNPGSAAGPIMKIASGGELSRFLLALKVALADRGSAPTLIFDEIDAGVGGAVAEAIGVRLARLATGAQVMAVTHAPQVAARAGRHLLIEKAPREDGESVTTDVTVIDEDRRREEIARMLAGAVVTDEARAAAGRLLEPH